MSEDRQPFFTLISVMLLPGWTSPNPRFLECRTVELPAISRQLMVGMRVTALQFGHPPISRLEDARVGCTIPVRNGDHCTIELLWPYDLPPLSQFTWCAPTSKEHCSVPSGRVVATCRIAGWTISDIRGEMAVRVENEPLLCRAMRERVLEQSELARVVQAGIDRDLSLLRGPGAPTHFGWILGRRETALLLWADQLDEERVRHWMARDPGVRFFWKAWDRLEEVTMERLLLVLDQLPMHARR